MATAYPVHYSVERPARFKRVQLLIRVVAFCALGLLGLSFGTVFMFAYLALPVFAASRLAAAHEPDGYVARDGPRVLAALRWFAGVSAWAALIAEHLPTRPPSEALTLAAEAPTHPTPASAIWRVASGIPSALVLAVLAGLGTFVWIWAALSILAVQRVGPATFQYLVGLQRWSLRLLAYQASLTDEYPPFSFADSAALPAARVAP